MAWRLELVPVGALPPTLLPELRQDLESYLHREVSISDSVLDPGPAFDPGRRQYLATEFMQRLLIPTPRPEEHRIGITSVDLYLPVFSHVFGSAQLGGHVGVASTRRLCVDLIGDPAWDDRTRERLAKEVLHELGHTLGLIHCHFSWCVMAASRLPEEIDLKDLRFCDACSESLGSANRAGAPTLGLQ